MWQKTEHYCNCEYIVMYVLFYFRNIGGQLSKAASMLHCTIGPLKWLSLAYQLLII